MGRSIKDNELAFRTATAAIVSAGAAASSAAVEIKGGNLNSPMDIEIEYWGAETSAGAGTLGFSVTSCATEGGSYVELIDKALYSVVLSTDAVAGRFRIPYANENPFGKVLPVFTGTDATCSYTAFLVPRGSGG